MRALLLSLLLAVPAFGQAEVSALPNAGYDFGYGGPTVGVGLETGIRIPVLPISLALRSSGDVVLVDELPFNRSNLLAEAEGGDAYVLRLGAEVIGRWERRLLAPYAKVGFVRELETVSSPRGRFQFVDVDAVAGLGLEVGRIYVEGTHGFGDASRRRLAVGVRL